MMHIAHGCPLFLKNSEERLELLATCEIWRFFLMVIVLDSSSREFLPVIVTLLLPTQTSSCNEIREMKITRWLISFCNGCKGYVICTCKLPSLLTDWYQNHESVKKITFIIAINIFTNILWMNRHLKMANFIRRNKNYGTWKNSFNRMFDENNDKVKITIKISYVKHFIRKLIHEKYVFFQTW